MEDLKSLTTVKTAHSLMKNVQANKKNNIDTYL